MESLGLGDPDRVLARDRLGRVVPVRLEQTNPLLEQGLLLPESLALGMALGDHERSPRQERRSSKVGRDDGSVELETIRG